MAEANTSQNTVKNDFVKFNNTVIMNDTETSKDGPLPTNIPSPTTIARDVLYTPNHRISSSLLNKANTESSGQIYYDLLPGNVNGGANKVLPINGINTVTVHTPSSTTLGCRTISHIIRKQHLILPVLHSSWTVPSLCVSPHPGSTWIHPVIPDMAIGTMPNIFELNRCYFRLTSIQQIENNSSQPTHGSTFLLTN